MKMLKTTRSDCWEYAKVDTIWIDNKDVFLAFYDSALNLTDYLVLSRKFYCKRFLKNAVNAWAVGASIEKIRERAERYATEKY